ATEYAISAWDPRCVINFGCAGAHTREVLPGDVIIGTKLAHHGRMRMTADTGMVPMDIPFTVAGEPEQMGELTCDPNLVAAAEAASKGLVFDAWPDEHRLPIHPESGEIRVHTGVVSSADVWLQDSAMLDAAHQRTGSLCEDMEAGAIAQVAALHGVPFLTIKDISNNEFHKTSVFEGTESALPTAEVGKRAALLSVATVDRLLDDAL
ncbi:MAG TPA: 5'-methylthioadenosine/S-adenosylhomocysteine nucleosidase, partial [Thermomicrobiales bacterium]|nr:5'-methylthioadenosine/S-adenosylhomocysteine nucleosidase [Thermomicrobiales bacterium]